MIFTDALKLPGGGAQARRASRGASTASRLSGRVHLATMYDLCSPGCAGAAR